MGTKLQTVNIQGHLYRKCLPKKNMCVPICSNPKIDHAMWAEEKLKLSKSQKLQRRRIPQTFRRGSQSLNDPSSSTTTTYLPPSMPSKLCTDQASSRHRASPRNRASTVSRITCIIRRIKMGEDRTKFGQHLVVVFHNFFNFPLRLHNPMVQENEKPIVACFMASLPALETSSKCFAQWTRRRKSLCPRSQLGRIEVIAVRMRLFEPFIPVNRSKPCRFLLARSIAWLDMEATGIGQPKSLYTFNQALVLHDVTCNLYSAAFRSPRARNTASKVCRKELQSATMHGSLGPETSSGGKSRSNFPGTAEVYGYNWKDINAMVYRWGLSPFRDKSGKEKKRICRCR